MTVSPAVGRKLRSIIRQMDDVKWAVPPALYTEVNRAANVLATAIGVRKAARPVKRTRNRKRKEVKKADK